MLIATFVVLLGQGNRWTKTLHNGTTVNFKCLANFSEKRCWSAEGEALETLYLPYSYSPDADDNAHRRVIAIFRVDHVKSKGFPSVKFRYDSTHPSVYGIGYPESEMRPQQPYEASAQFKIPRTSTLGEVEVGCASDPWKVVGVCGQKGRYISGKHFDPTFSTINPGQGKGPISLRIKIKVPKDLRDGATAYRLVAYNAQKKAFQDGGSLTGIKENGPSEFAAMTYGQQTYRIELQTRPYEWVTFHDVALKPISK